MESAAKSIKDLNKVYQEAVYGQTAGQELAKREKDDDAAGAPNKDKRHVVTYADKRGNTPAYQKYKAGDKNYKAADHLKDEYEPLATSLEESGKFTVEEIQAILEKDSYKTVAAVIDYDRSKKGSKDATYDSDHGEKKKAKQERDYAAWERSKMKKDDPNWKHKKYHTGMHGEEVERLGKSEISELHKGRHGQSEKEYQAGRSDAGKRISGDDKHGPASYTRRGVVDQKPTKPGEKPKHTPKLGSAEKAELAYRKSRLKKEEYVDEAKVDAGKTPHEKETIRNQRNTPPGANTKFDTSVFITRKSGESPTSARGRKRREAHAARRGVKQEGYQRNPEKGEAEERKAEKARKESGRMPPRGDKRREDFEKWYAANVK